MALGGITKKACFFLFCWSLLWQRISSFKRLTTLTFKCWMFGKGIVVINFTPWVKLRNDTKTGLESPTSQSERFDHRANTTCRDDVKICITIFYVTIQAVFANKINNMSHKIVEAIYSCFTHNDETIRILLISFSFCSTFPLIWMSIVTNS